MLVQSPPPKLHGFQDSSAIYSNPNRFVVLEGVPSSWSRQFNNFIKIAERRGSDAFHHGLRITQFWGSLCAVSIYELLLTDAFLVSWFIRYKRNSQCKGERTSLDKDRTYSRFWTSDINTNVASRALRTCFTNQENKLVTVSHLQTGNIHISKHSKRMHRTSKIKWITSTVVHTVHSWTIDRNKLLAVKVRLPATVKFCGSSWWTCKKLHSSDLSPLLLELRKQGQKLVLLKTKLFCLNMDGR